MDKIKLQKESGEQQSSKFHLRDLFRPKGFKLRLRKKLSDSGNSTSAQKLHQATTVSGNDRIILSNEHVPGQFIPFLGKPCSEVADARFEPSWLCENCKEACETIRSRNSLGYAVGGFTYVKTGATMQYYKLQHYTEMEQLQTSAQSGCHLCSLLLPTSDDPVCSPINSEYSLYLFRTHQSKEPKFDLTLGRRMSDRDPGAYYWPMYLNLKSSAVRPSRSEPMTLSTASNRSRQWIQTMLDVCRNTHHDCCQHDNTPQPLPKRLIHVDDSADIPILHLVEPTMDSVDVSRYMALSYCWGSDASVRLTTTTMWAFRNGIPMDEFPKTYRDAVQICGWLGIEYLWIDALCIIQDSDQDWFEQAAAMCQVYRNAYLTICALGASGTQQGCFAERNPLYYEPCVLYQDEENVSWYFEARKVVTEEWFRHKPLCQRGWTFQERMLSPRTLYFGDFLIFECLEGMKPEFDVLMQHLLDNNLRMKQQILDLSNAKDAQGVQTAFTDLWQEIVQVYTSAKLTYKEDRVPALAGIVELVEKSFSAKCHAGFWQPVQPHMLLWEVSYSSNRGESYRLTNDRAPTWSWLAMDCPVAWNQTRPKTGTDLCSVLHVSEIESETVHRVTLLRGQIILRGSLCKILSIRDLYPEGILGGMNRGFGSMRLDVTVQGFEGPGARHAFITADYWIEEQRNFDFVEPVRSRAADEILEETQINLPVTPPLLHGRKIRRWEQLYFLPVRHSNPECCGLILCPDPREGNHEHFIRIGIMNFEGKEPYDILPLEARDIILV